MLVPAAAIETGAEPSRRLWVTMSKAPAPFFGCTLHELLVYIYMANLTPPLHPYAPPSHPPPPSFAPSTSATATFGGDARRRDLRLPTLVNPLVVRTTNHADNTPAFAARLSQLDASRWACASVRPPLVRRPLGKRGDATEKFEVCLPSKITFPGNTAHHLPAAYSERGRHLMEQPSGTYTPASTWRLRDSWGLAKVGDLRSRARGGSASRS